MINIYCLSFDKAYIGDRCLCLRTLMPKPFAATGTVVVVYAKCLNFCFYTEFSWWRPVKEDLPCFKSDTL